MRWAVLGVALAAFMGTAGTVTAQEPSGPPTLENLLQGGKQPTARPAAVEASEPQPKSVRPAGTCVRPKDSYKHPDLDKAWADYEAAVAKVTESIKAAIAKQFDAATAKGDLDAAEKWQMIGEKFEKAGELPAESETQSAVTTAGTEFTKAQEELTKAYETVVKALTKEKKIAEAKAVRAELLSMAPAKKDGSAGPETGNRKEQVAGNQKAVVFLSDLEEQDVSITAGFGWSFGKNGRVGGQPDAGQIFVRGFKSEKGLGMHPASDGASSVTYKVPDRCLRFEGVAAIADGGGGTVVFEVLAGHTVLWKSRVLQGGGAFENCRIAIKDAGTITLIVRCIGGNHGATAVWVDPRFIVK